MRSIHREMTARILQRGLGSLHIGAQIYVSLKGKVVADFAIGDTKPGVPMRTDSLMIWLSCTKPIVAVALAQLWETGRLDLSATEWPAKKNTSRGSARLMRRFMRTWNWLMVSC